MGKSTQIDLFRAWLGERATRSRNAATRQARRWAKRCVNYFASCDCIPNRAAEMFLYMACRAQLTASVIEPALARARSSSATATCSRTVVYQATPADSTSKSLAIGRTATRSVRPTLTFVLDLSPEAAARRMNRPLDRMEQQARSSSKNSALLSRRSAPQPTRSSSSNADRPIEEIQAENPRVGGTMRGVAASLVGIARRRENLD